jgi:Flp pilus assembly protein TadG
MRRPAARLRALLSATAGAAAVEFALVSGILVALLLNVVDFSLLIWAQMQVDYAAESGAQAAYNTCSGGTMPATTHCATLNSVVTTAIHGTSLGSSVTLASGSPSETYYCVSGSSLQSVGTPASPPSPFNCSAAGDASKTPGDYVRVAVSYSFTPLFGGISLAPSETLTGAGLQRLQ